MGSAKYLFTTIIELSNYKTLVNFFGFQQSAYWQIITGLVKKTKSTVAGLGQASVEIYINTITPLLVAMANLKMMTN
ncbi:MAG: DUF2851 family protein [Cytophagales bacterium]|nr:DUF2851 family protein [Cytophagales bacterium]